MEEILSTCNERIISLNKMCCGLEHVPRAETRTALNTDGGSLTATAATGATGATRGAVSEAFGAAAAVEYVFAAGAAVVFGGATPLGVDTVCFAGGSLQ